jgi:hypothetical protein
MPSAQKRCKNRAVSRIHKATSTVIDALREELRSSFVPVQASILSLGRDQHGVNSKLEAVLHWWQAAHDIIYISMLGMYELVASALSMAKTAAWYDAVHLGRYSGATSGV